MKWFSQSFGLRGLVIASITGLMVGAHGCESSSTTPSATTSAPATDKTKSATDDKATPSLVVEGGETYDFGATEVGQEFEHVFEIKNIGDKDVAMKAGVPSCSTCTSFRIDKEVVKPNETVKAFVKWQIKNENPEFRQYAPIMLDGGKDLKLYVVGKVVKRIVMSPSDRWALGSVSEGKPITFNATMVSSVLDHFEIESVTNANPALKVTATPMSPEKLEQNKAKSGYDLKAILSPDFPVGEFTDRVAINVLAPHALKIVVEAHGRRSGPIQIFGPNWNEEQLSLGLGDFDPKKDYQVRMNLFTRGVEGDLAFEKLECKDKRFSVEVKPDAKFTGQSGDHRKYDFFIKVAGSDKPVVYTRTEPLLLEITTNQPKVKTIILKVRAQALP